MKRLILPDEKPQDIGERKDLKLKISPQKKKELDDMVRKYKLSVVEILRTWIKK